VNTPDKSGARQNRQRSTARNYLNFAES